MNYDNILTAEHGDGALRTGVITLNRPKQLNALSDALTDDLGAALKAHDANDGIGCIGVSGSRRCRRRGHGELRSLQVYKAGYITRNWETLTTIRKPFLAAVAGFALGGGCEVAMMCDFIIATDTAKLGQPEIKLGIIPGAGGTKRLSRAAGKAKAMDMVLTSRMIDVAEAERAGLVSRVVPSTQLMDEALAAAAVICSLSLPSVMMAKEAVNRAFDAPPAKGVRFERRLFHSSFGRTDQREGTAAFLDKRRPAFVHR